MFSRSSGLRPPGAPAAAAPRAQRSRESVLAESLQLRRQAVVGPRRDSGCRVVTDGNANMGSESELQIYFHTARVYAKGLDENVRIKCNPRYRLVIHPLDSFPNLNTPKETQSPLMPRGLPFPDRR